MRGGKVAMLLRTDFDHAKTRRHLFADCPAFARKIVLSKRIWWIKNSIGQPSFNHAWYIGIISTLASQSLNTICSIKRAVGERKQRKIVSREVER
jgi:hypothetical protein